MMANIAEWMMVGLNYGIYKKTKILSKESELEVWKPRSLGRNYSFAFSHYEKEIEGNGVLRMPGDSYYIHSFFFRNLDRQYGTVVVCNGCTSKSVNGGEMNYKIFVHFTNYFIKQ